MPAVLVGLAVILCQKIDQKVAVFGVLARPWRSSYAAAAETNSDAERPTAWLGM
jgi:CO/xanthine dehydrogenase FAD-binding subunit